MPVRQSKPGCSGRFLLSTLLVRPFFWSGASSGATQTEDGETVDPAFTFVDSGGRVTPPFDTEMFCSQSPGSSPGYFYPVTAWKKIRRVLLFS